ncbi:MAG: PAS domain-containing protein, partial [Proteobacteria bacterium]|nr:PAS domain-containing protein [Pseudomonadota bacterium]
MPAKLPGGLGVKPKSKQPSKDQEMSNSVLKDQLRNFEVLEKATILQLKTMDRPGESVGMFLKEMVGDFEGCVPDALDKLIAAAKQKNIKSIGHLSHKIKGICRNVGVSRLAEMSALIESDSQRGIITDSNVFLTLHQEYKEALLEFQRIFDNETLPTPVVAGSKSLVTPIRKELFSDQSSVTSWRGQDSETNKLNTKISSVQLGAFEDAMKDQAVFDLDPKGLVTTWNKGAARLTGFSSEDIIGLHFSTLYVKNDVLKGLPDEHLRVALAKGKFETEAVRIRKDGSTYWAHVIINANFNAEGEHTGFTNFRR